MWKLTGHPKTQQITKQLAELFAKMEPAIQDRPMSETRLQVYRKLMQEGGFRPMSWAAAMCKETGETYRVNGKHTSTVCSQIDLKSIPVLHAVVEYYECDTLKDVAELYSTYDSKMQSRNTSDINKAFASTIPQLASIPLRTISLCVTGITYSSVTEEWSRIQPQERAEGLFDHWDFVVWVNTIITSESKAGHIRRMPVVAAMYSTWSKYPRVSDEFWTMVRDETASTPDHPTRKLSRFLLTNLSNTARGTFIRRRVPNREFFVKSLHAWNSFRKNEATNLNYHINSPIPDVK